ncbi:MAG TPA: hypothetical protein VHW23_47980 [Kofleriaceae bacterium]|nr:hypothetical protein [Kofleriaceae bacterium]
MTRKDVEAGTARRPRSAIEEALRAIAALPRAADLPQAPRRFRDDGLGAWVVPVLPGEVYVTDQREHLMTVLGSCVSTCVRNPATGAGGMNHLVLPDAQRPVRALACDGLASLDRLLDRVLAYGGRAEQLEIKVFGGGRVIGGHTDIGRTNVAAVHDYLASRGLAIAGSDVGGGVARRLRYEPHTGRAVIRRIVLQGT